MITFRVIIKPQIRFEVENTAVALVRVAESIRNKFETKPLIFRQIIEHLFIQFVIFFLADVADNGCVRNVLIWRPVPEADPDCFRNLV